ncbi:MAG: nucleotidyl transferase AbiEii/AbiGii toxin family protein [Anaerolineales bacterium]
MRADILEKDYYITLILKELADKPDQAFAYFKGGTALYKAIGSIKRFSEDIDLTVSIQDCRNPSQAKKRLERATLDYSCLSINEEDAENFKRKGAITSIYNYESVVDVDREDELNRFLKVKIEATSFTVSEPHEPMLIAPLIFDIATDEQKEILINTYAPELKTYPVILSLPAPELRSYPPETVVAEKLQAMIYLGSVNSRTTQACPELVEGLLSQTRPWR